MELTEISRRNALRVAILALAAGTLPGCNLSLPGTLRFKYKLSFTTDFEGETKGSVSNILVVGTKEPLTLEEGPWSFQGFGVGPIIDLGARGVLLALLESVKTISGNRTPVSLRELPFRLSPLYDGFFPSRGKDSNLDQYEPEALLEALSHVPRPIVLPIDYFPQIVWVEDRDDIESAKFIDPLDVTSQSNGLLTSLSFSFDNPDGPPAKVIGSSGAWIGQLRNSHIIGRGLSLARFTVINVEG